MYTIVYEKSFQQIWRELKKKGWEFKKSKGLSNDHRYMPPDGNLNGTEGVDYFVGETSLLQYCRRQGWLSFAPGPNVAAPPAVAGTPDTAVSAQELTAAVASIKKKPANPRAGAISTPAEQAQNTPSAPTKSSTHKAARTPNTTGKGKRKASTPMSRSKRRHTEEAITDATQCEPDNPDFHVPDETDDDPDHDEQSIPDVIDNAMESDEDAVPDLPVATQQRPEGGTARNPRVVTLDDFDSDDFVMALRRDRLFEPVDADDLNVGIGDWLLELDSEAEGDEDTILADKNDEDESDEESTVPLIDDEPDDPVDFELKKPELDRLQLEEWEVYDEHHSRDLHVDAAPLYEGPFGPTKAALAFADSPLAMFYFFLPKELWRRIAEETNAYRLSCVDEIAVATRTRAVERKKTVPSTSVLTVEEYKTKLRRKHPIAPHELVRFIGLLVARSLEPRRESLSRHWITKVEGALSRGTFGQFLSRDQFQDIVRYLHFNDNAKQPVSGDRAFKIRPVLQALQKTFFWGYRLGARISFDEGMVPMRHRRNPMRQYMSTKPNKWGTKFYMTCCAESAYCARLDIYCGKANKEEKDVAQRAVVKNLVKALRGQPSQRLVCTDNYYTSIPLSDKLLKQPTR